MESRSSCDAFDALIEEFGPVAPPAARRSMEEHAARCPRCAALLAEEDALDRLLEAHLRPPALSTEFARRLRERIQVPATQVMPHWVTWLEAAAAAGLAAAVVVTVSLPKVMKVLTAAPAPSLVQASWVAGAAAVVTVLWFACEALADSRFPGR